MALPAWRVKRVSMQTTVLETLIRLLEQKAVPGTDQIKQDISQNPDFMLSDILDSVDKVEFFLMLEEALNISIPDQDQDMLETFSQTVQYVDET